MSKEERITYNIQNEDGIGDVMIADDVVASIAAFAALEVEGVAAMEGGHRNELMGKFGVKNPSKGAKVDILEGVVTVYLSLSLVYGYSLKKVTAKVQEKVKSMIENMTGLQVADVNIRITGVEVPEEA